jgi:hypothetical protein
LERGIRNPSSAIACHHELGKATAQIAEAVIKQDWMAACPWDARVPRSLAHCWSHNAKPLFDILQIPDPLGVILRRWKLRGNEIQWQPTR